MNYQIKNVSQDLKYLILSQDSSLIVISILKDLTNQG
jgi:hypothetical protein